MKKLTGGQAAVEAARELQFRELGGSRLFHGRLCQRALRRGADPLFRLPADRSREGQP